LTYKQLEKRAMNHPGECPPVADNFKG